MKRFNEIITVQVDVDTIANKLLVSLDRENPHAELIAETTVGLLLHRGGLGMLYNALNGWRDEINIKENEIYEIEGKYLDLYSFDDDRNLSEDGRSKDDVFLVKTTKVNPYVSTGKTVEIEVSYWRKGQSQKYKNTIWVEHSRLQLPTQVEL